MKPIPKTENPLVLRTDFSNQSAREAICAKIQKPVGIFRFRANVEFLDDEEYSDITTHQLVELLPTITTRPLLSSLTKLQSQILITRFLL